MLYDQVYFKNNDRDRAFGTYGGGGEMHTGMWWGNPTDRNRSEYIVIDGNIIFKRIFKIWFGVWTGLFWLRKERGNKFL